MKRTRFLAVFARSNETRSKWEVRLDELVACKTELRWILKNGPLLIVAAGGHAEALSQHKVLIGSLFERVGGDGWFHELDGVPQDATDWHEKLIEHAWGGYVAFELDRSCNKVRILRAPLGDLPCFWTQVRDAVLLGSDLDFMMAAGLPRPSIDRAALVRYLAQEDLRTNETCLRGIAEIRGGDQLTLTANGEGRRETLWSPWTFARSEQTANARDYLERAVLDAALWCTDKLAKEQGKIVLKLSGGLDSSIVAACLKEGGHKFTAINLVTHDASGDERTHARAVATSLGAPIVEEFRDWSAVSLGQSAAALLSRPQARGFTQETARICAKVAAQEEAGAIFDGGGGDNVFCSVQSARPAADCLMTQDPDASFWRTATSIAELAQVGLWQVARRAWSIRLRRSPVYHWDLDMRFLSKDACQEQVRAFAHPWLMPPSGTFPGKAAHVALLAAAQSVIEGSDPADDLPTFSPLIVQPVVEVCLAIPSWSWFEAGRNRAAARRAFAGTLPTATLERRSKGAPDSFIAELYEANHALIRTMLLDGTLRNMKLLDAKSLGDALDDPSPVRGHDFLRIMRLADAEAWSRSWSS